MKRVVMSGNGVEEAADMRRFAQKKCLRDTQVEF
jgi:hypothetical protein